MPKGSCMCGKVAYSYDKAVMKAVCHCLTCRKVSGSAFATTLLVPEDSFTTNVAPPLSTKVIHESGMALVFYGCGSCPATLYKTADGFPGMKIIFAGTLDGDEDVAKEGKPDAEIWIKYRAPWLSALEGCQQFEEFPPPN